MEAQSNESSNIPLFTIKERSQTQPPENPLLDKWLDKTEETDPDLLCGIGPFKPRWLQRLRTVEVYLFVISVVAMLESAYYFYNVSVISTVEKRYSFDSESSGWLFTIYSALSVVGGVVLGHFTGKPSLHRPRILAGTYLVIVLSLVISAAPYFKYGPGTHLLSIDKGSVLKNETKVSEFCEAGVDRDMGKCGEDSSKEAEFDFAFACMAIRNVMLGIAVVGQNILATPYLDDNVSKDKAPLYLGIYFSVHLFGPAVGFYLASLCLNYYEDINYDPGISKEDPRWIGAWWLGYLILAAVYSLYAIILCLFPRSLVPIKKEEKQTIVKEPFKLMPALKDFLKEFLKLLRNPFLMFLLVSASIQLLGLEGFMIFKSKYIETQYMKSASEANLFSGTITIFGLLLGTLLSSIIIKIKKPNAKVLIAWTILVDIIYGIIMIAGMFLGCPTMELSGASYTSDGGLLPSACSADCSCSTRVFQPICSMDGQTAFFSPCYAGCTESTKINDTTIFKNCACMANGDVKEGFCPSDCGSFFPYIIVTGIAKFIVATASIPGVILTFRCVEPEQKGFTMGLSESMFALLGFLPSPVIYGALVDMACQVWEKSCEKEGNCWVYNAEKMRYLLHAPTVFFIMCGVVFSCILFKYINRLRNLYDDDDK